MSEDADDGAQDEEELEEWRDGVPIVPAPDLERLVDEGDDDTTRDG